jgi:cobalt-zinc-cadmium efflux system membrane fusion protein
LAVIESNQNLVGYEIKSQISGVVIERHATLGEFVPEAKEIFIVADLSELWADFQIYRDDFGSARSGQDIVVHIGDEDKTITSKVIYVSPVTDQATQSKKIRASIANTDLSLRPGLFVTADLKISSKVVSLAVKRSALQTFRDWDVVFINEGNIFQAMPVELGGKDTQFVEIISGIKNGQKYVAENSFIIKADIEKSGASHDH